MSDIAIRDQGKLILQQNHLLYGLYSKLLTHTACLHPAFIYARIFSLKELQHRVYHVYLGYVLP